MLMKIAEEMPRELQGVLACCNPVPPLVRQNANELWQLVKQARLVPLIKSEMPIKAPSRTFITRTEVTRDQNSSHKCPLYLRL
ncbi:exosome complex component 10-like [Petromyzon marinus]|uniref:exosome complex component 10-like n=1 Tax=Petromyzon marinus TaxID=7757 RepID=UPI003F6F9A88